MTPRQIALVRQSWVKVQPIADDAAKIFYERLFEIEPSLRSMFRGDMAEQGRKLMSMLSVVIHALERIDSLASLQDLAARHATYGLKPEHYERIREALLWTLGKGLGRSFDPEVREAWLSFYARLAGRMQAGARA
jgi:hemoglobin-like flavoprotein